MSDQDGDPKAGPPSEGGRRAVLHEEWSGPLPPPHLLKQFDDVIENGAERIVQQWESESAHRHQIELIDARAFARGDMWGRIFAFAFVVLALAVAALAVAYDQPWVAVILGGGTIASVVWAFMRTHRDNAPA